mgnify:CR=1 FL=1
MRRCAYNEIVASQPPTAPESVKTDSYFIAAHKNVILSYKLRLDVAPMIMDIYGVSSESFPYITKHEPASYVFPVLPPIKVIPFGVFLAPVTN